MTADPQAGCGAAGADLDAREADQPARDVGAVSSGARRASSNVSTVNARPSWPVRPPIILGNGVDRWPAQ